MRSKLLIVLVLSIFGLNALADGHEKPFSVFIGISTDNPSAMVGAWDTFMASECGQSLPGQVSIMNEFFNGDHPSTHTLVIGYPNQQAWAQGLANNRCVEWSQLMRSTSTLGKPEWQNLGMSVLSGGDLSKDGAYTIYQMNITDEGKYAAAFEDLMKGLMKAGQKITSYGLVRIVGGAQSDVGTHFAYVGAANGLDQLDNVANSDEKSLQKFRSKVSSIRTVNRTNINYVAKRYQVFNPWNNQLLGTIPAIDMISSLRKDEDWIKRQIKEKDQERVQLGVKVATTLFTYLYSLVQIMPAEPISYLKTQLLFQTKLSQILKIIKPKVGRSERI